MKLVLVRHGESIWNKKNLFTGWMDVELSSTGVEEAKQAGQLLKKQGYHFDLCYTSYLRRAIHTLDHILTELDQCYLPVIKTWKLNERHYGALQGLNKAETAKVYGEEQVKLWRRSFDILPPALNLEDDTHPINQAMYASIDPSLLPNAESLETTIARVVPYFNEEIKEQMKQGKQVLVAAHGNSLRALMMYFEHLSKEAIMEVNIPTGVPLVYEFDESFQVKRRYYLLEDAILKQKMETVANQGAHIHA